MLGAIQLEDFLATAAALMREIREGPYYTLVKRVWTDRCSLLDEQDQFAGFEALVTHLEPPNSSRLPTTP
jgi:hypothetical protein